MLRQLILYPKNIFRFIRPVHVHLKTDKVDLKKSHREKNKICIFFQSSHQVDMKNVVECPSEFFAYFNALETRGVQTARLRLITRIKVIQILKNAFLKHLSFKILPTSFHTLSYFSTNDREGGLKNIQFRQNFRC